MLVDLRNGVERRRKLSSTPAARQGTPQFALHLFLEILLLYQTFSLFDGKNLVSIYFGHLIN